MSTVQRLVAVWMFALAGTAAAQIDAFDWKLAGNPAGLGQQTPGNLHVIGPDYGGCDPHLTWFETVMPVGGESKVRFADGPAWATVRLSDASKLEPIETRLRIPQGRSEPVLIQFEDRQYEVRVDAAVLLTANAGCNVLGARP